MNVVRNDDRYDAMALQRWENEGGSAAWQASSQPRAPRLGAPVKRRLKSRQLATKKLVTLTELDRFRLGRLLTCAETAALAGAQARLDLEARLEDAQAIPVDAAPRSLVTMNSTLRLTDMDSGTQRVCTLVYPDDRDLFPQSVGVFQPLGLRLLGRQVGESIQLPVNGQTKRFRIDSILYQPEAAGELAR